MIFLIATVNFVRGPALYVAQHHRLRFLLTAPKLSRRIIKGMSAGVLLKALMTALN
jgi:hypothetical protein